MLKQIRSLLRVLKSRDDFEQGMPEELRFHVEQYMSDPVARGGMPGLPARFLSAEDSQRGNRVRRRPGFARLYWPHTNALRPGVRRLG